MPRPAAETSRILNSKYSWYPQERVSQVAQWVVRNLSGCQAEAMELSVMGCVCVCVCVCVHTLQAEDMELSVMVCVCVCVCIHTLPYHSELEH